MCFTKIRDFQDASDYHVTGSDWLIFQVLSRDKAEFREISKPSF